MEPMISIRFPPIPNDTARASEAAFGKDHPYLKIGDGLNVVLSDLNLEAMTSTDSGLADSFWPYSLATILQYWEDLTDRQMANATRTRVDLKYALHLPLIFPGMSPSGLCSFRRRLLLNQAGKDALRQMVDRLGSFIGSLEKPLADPDLIISTICTISRWDIVSGTMSNVVEALAASYPEWLRTIALPHWYRRYYYKQTSDHNTRASKNIKANLQSVGEDGRHLLEAVEKSENASLKRLPEIRTLRREWQSQFEWENDQLRLRSQNCSNCEIRS
jgi:transposase